MKRMRFSVVSLIGAILVVFSSLAFAAPHTVSFQGVLRTAAGAPVPDASYDATFSLYDTPTGGVPIWTETQPVTTTGGLFTCELGAFVDLLDSYVHQTDDGIRYLQIQIVISGAPVVMSPRTRLSDVPSAMSAKSINVVRSSGSTTGTIRMVATPDSVVETSSVDNGISGTSSRSYKNNENCEWTIECPTGFSSLTTSSSGTGHVLSGHMGSTTGTIRMMASGDSVVETSGMENGASSKQYYNNEHCVWNIECPSISGSTTGTIRTVTTGDSIVESSSVSDGITPGSSSTQYIDREQCTWSVKCPSLTGSTTGTIRMQATGDSASFSVQQGVDEGNHRDGWNLLQADGTLQMTGRITSGLPPGEPVIDNMRLRVDPLSSSVAINTKGTGADKGRTAGMTVDDLGAISYLDIDDDDDGVSDASITQSCTPTVTKLAIKTKGTSAQRSVHTVETDIDGDGTYDMSVENGTDHNGAEIRLNGLPPGEPVIGTLVISTNGDTSRVSASSRFGSGPRQTTSMDGSFESSSMECKTDVDDDGDGDGGIQCKSIETRATLKTYYENGDIPTEEQSFVTHTADADSAHTEMQTRLNGLPPGEPVIGTLTMTTSSSSSSLSMGNPESKNIGLYVSSVTGQCMMTMMDDGGGGVGSTPETTIVIDAHAKRFGIGVANPSHPIDHSSGAKLTDAGDWVNASSEKLKENFEAVNGAEVLEKIEDLSVTRWNYKADDDNITHIGPTAEAFHDAFKTGESDKAISTIDPSGVALVAIKELSKRNKQLEKQNEQLQKQLADLQKAVDKLLKQTEKGR